MGFMYNGGKSSLYMWFHLNATGSPAQYCAVSVSYGRGVSGLRVERACTVFSFNASARFFAILPYT